MSDRVEVQNPIPKERVVVFSTRLKLKIVTFLCWFCLVFLSVVLLRVLVLLSTLIFLSLHVIAPFCCEFCRFVVPIKQYSFHKLEAKLALCEQNSSFYWVKFGPIRNSSNPLHICTPFFPHSTCYREVNSLSIRRAVCPVLNCMVGSTCILVCWIY